MSKANERKAREALQAAGVKPGVINKVIEQAASTGKGGLSSNELAFIQQNAQQLVGPTRSQVDAKAFLGTTGSRRDALSGGGTPTPRTETRRTSNADGSVTIFYSDGTSETIGGQRQLPDPTASAREADMRSAYAIVEDAFSKYGLGSLVPLIRQFRIKGLSPEEAQLELEKAPEFRARFSGNEGRIAKGLQAYKPGEYLAAEEAYANLLRSNNLSALANKSTFDKLISGAVSPAETQDRINLVFNKIDNAPTDVKNELTRYFSAYGVGDPNVQRTQIAEAILSGEDPAMKLEMNVRKAQLRAGATAAGLAPTEERLAAIERLTAEAGVSNAYVAGQQGFQTLAQIQPQADILSQRYQMAPLEEPELEKEAFIGLRSQQRRRLLEQEKATFAGESGLTQASLAQSVAGQI
jgi:hypothetical protein